MLVNYTPMLKVNHELKLLSQCYSCLHYDAGRDRACLTPGKLSDSNRFLTLQGKPKPHGTYANRGPYVTTFP